MDNIDKKKDNLNNYKDVHSDNLHDILENLMGKPKKYIMWFASGSRLYDYKNVNVSHKNRFKNQNNYSRNDPNQYLNVEQKVVNVQLTAPINSWSRYTESMNSEYVSYVVVVITEPILLLMLDERYRSVFDSLIEKIVVSGIKHSILLSNSIYRGQLTIFKSKQRYYNRYLNKQLFGIHQNSYYKALDNSGFRELGTIKFENYFPVYIERLLALFRDNLIDLPDEDYDNHDAIDFKNYILKILDGLGEYYSDEERNYIVTKPKVPVIKDIYDLSDSFCVENSFESKGLGIRCKISDFGAPIVSGMDEIPYGEKDNSDSDYICQKEDYFGVKYGDRITRLDINNKDFAWRQVALYISRYGRGRDTEKSKGVLIDTLNRITFNCLIVFLELEPAEDDKLIFNSDMKKIVDSWREDKRLKVVPYEDDADFYGYLEDYIGDSRRIVFNKYILKSQLFADEMDKFMTMFQDYVSSVRKMDVRFEKEPTERGIIYIIKSYSPELVRDNFSMLVDEFSDFLDSIDNEMLEIDSIVKNYDVPQERAEELVRKYSRDIKRLKNDLKYDYAERKLKILRTLEEELTEADIAISDLKYLEEKASELIQPKVVMNIENFMVVNDNRIKNEVYNHIETLVEGDYHYNNYDTEILELIRKHAENQEELINALHILKDEKVDKDKRKSAAGKLKRFFNCIVGAAGEVGVNLLASYIQSLLGF